MDSTFYIVPSTKTYYEETTSTSKEEALNDFVAGMDTDISAYFDVTDKKPATYPHEYKYPDGNFQVAMSILVATVSENTGSVYYTKDLEKDMRDVYDAYIRHADAIGKLQESYDDIVNSLRTHKESTKILKTNKKFYKILKILTGFKFDNDDAEETTIS